MAASMLLAACLALLAPVLQWAVTGAHPVTSAATGLPYVLGADLGFLCSAGLLLLTYRALSQSRSLG
ncbi:MAG: hypothetical protein AAGD10_14310 [Myxococcota bacterium]